MAQCEPNALYSFLSIYDDIFDRCSVLFSNTEHFFALRCGMNEICEEYTWDNRCESDPKCKISKRKTDKNTKYNFINFLKKDKICTYHKIRYSSNVFVSIRSIYCTHGQCV